MTKKISKSFPYLIAVAYSRCRDRVALFVETSKKNGLYTPTEQEEALISTLLTFPEPGYKVLKYVKDEFAALDPEAFYELDAQAVLNVVIDCAVEGYILDTFGIDIHAY